MMFAAIFVVLALLALSLIVYVAKGNGTRGRNLEELRAQLQFLDVEALRNLMDEREDQFLRQHLPSPEFRAIQRERRLAAIEYVRCLGKNAAILVRLAEAAKQEPNPAVCQAAEKLFENAIRLRLYALRMIPRLYYGVVFPTAPLSPSALADNYDSVTRQVVMLGCLQHPAQEIYSAL